MFRKLAFAGAFAVLAALAGCAPSGTLGTVGGVLSGTINNPVTPKLAIELHAAFIIGVVIPASAYANAKVLPRCSHSAPPCSDQAIVNKMRLYINAADNALKRLDAWAYGNPKLNGQALYQAAVLAITTAKNFGLANGIKGIK